MRSSGGYIANNFRQGYRAEYLAKYIVSEFGPCKPIVEVSAVELKEQSHVGEIQNTLAEWISFDARNFSRRKADIPVIFGYLTWETNKSLATSRRTFYQPYFYGWQHTANAIKVIQECATLIALNQGKDSQLTKDLAEFIKHHGIDVQKFTNDALGI